MLAVSACAAGMAGSRESGGSRRSTWAKAARIVPRLVVLQGRWDNPKNQSLYFFDGDENDFSFFAIHRTAEGKCFFSGDVAGERDAYVSLFVCDGGGGWEPGRRW